MWRFQGCSFAAAELDAVAGGVLVGEASWPKHGPPPKRAQAGSRDKLQGQKLFFMLIHCIKLNTISSPILARLSFIQPPARATQADYLTARQGVTEACLKICSEFAAGTTVWNPCQLPTWRSRVRNTLPQPGALQPGSERAGRFQVVLDKQQAHKRGVSLMNDTLARSLESV
jgi:hypothetical protein